MTAELVSMARFAGGELRPRGDGFDISGPVPERLREQLFERRTEVLARLRREMTLLGATMYQRVQRAAGAKPVNLRAPRVLRAEGALEALWQRWQAGDATTAELETELGKVEDAYMIEIARARVA